MDDTEPEVVLWHADDDAVELAARRKSREPTPKDACCDEPKPQAKSASKDACCDEPKPEAKSACKDACCDDAAGDILIAIDSCAGRFCCTGKSAL